MQCPRSTRLLRVVLFDFCLEPSVTQGYNITLPSIILHSSFALLPVKSTAMSFFYLTRQNVEDVVIAADKVQFFLVFFLEHTHLILIGLNLARCF